MSKPIDGQIVRKLRKLQGMTQTELAEAAKVAKDTVSRLERGSNAALGPAGKALAKALGVEPTVLTGETRMPTPNDETTSSWLERFTYPLDVRVEGAVQNAFALASLRYRIPVEAIVKIAPLLFVLAAERSLSRRRSHLAALRETLDQADGIAGHFLHLPTTFLPSHAIGEYIGAEEESIDRLDILAEDLENDSIWQFQVHRSGYEASDNNPFVEALREEATDAAVATVTSFSTYGVDFSVCARDALALTGGDETLANDILSGGTRLREMPDALWSSSALPERVAWMRDSALERQTDLLSLYDELGLSDFAETTTTDGAVP